MKNISELQKSSMYEIFMRRAYQIKKYPLKTKFSRGNYELLFQIKNGTCLKRNLNYDKQFNNVKECVKCAISIISKRIKNKEMKSELIYLESTINFIYSEDHLSEIIRIALDLSIEVKEY